MARFPSCRTFLRLVLVVALFICYPCHLMATRARMDTFNGLNDFIRDEENVFTYPSMITEHANLVVVNLGRVTGTGEDLKFPLSFRSAGGTVALGTAQKYGVAGGFLAQEAFPDTVSYLQATTSSDPFYDLMRGWESDDRPGELGHHFDLLYGYALTPQLTAAVRVRRGLLSTTTRSQVDSLDNDVTVTMDGGKRLNMLEVVGGMTIRRGDRFTLYLAAGPRWHDYLLRIETPAETDEFRDAGNLSYSARFKLEQRLGDGLDLVGHGRYEKVDISGAGFDSDTGGYDRDRIQSTYGAGIAMRYHREERFDFTGGVLLSRQKLDDRTDFEEPEQRAPSSWQNLSSTKRILPQAFAALEISLKRWFVLRVGVAQTVREVEEHTEEQLNDVVVMESRQDVSSSISTNVGLRFLYRSLFVDFWLHSSAPYAPAAFIAGTGLTNPVLEVSTGYVF